MGGGSQSVIEDLLLDLGGDAVWVRVLGSTALLEKADTPPTWVAAPPAPALGYGAAGAAIIGKIRNYFGFRTLISLLPGESFSATDSQDNGLGELDHARERADSEVDRN